MKKFILFIASLYIRCHCVAQDPHFSQFFMAPNFINPALTSVSTSDWRVMANFRQQWGNAGTPFNTQAVAAEMKLTGTERDQPKDENMNTLAVGASFMSDQSMFGAFRSNYFIGTVSYKQILSNEHSVSLGMHGMYGNRMIDYSRLTFGEQFTSGGFDASFPSGEQVLSSIKPFISLGAGLLYNYRADKINVEVGAAAFHLNSPKQTALDDPKQIIPKRYIVHANMEYPLSPRTTFGFNACYQIQALPSYFSVGGAMGYDLSDGDKNSVLYGGVWFREGDSFYPFFGWSIGNLQLGFSYDVTHSQQNLGPSVPRSFEMSLVVRQRSDPDKKFGVGCPWR